MNIRQLLGDVDFQAMLQSLQEVIASPTSNLTLAVLLVSVLSLVLLIVVVLILFVLSGHDEEDDEDLQEVEGESEHEPASQEHPAVVGTPRGESKLAKALGQVGRIVVPLLMVVAFLMTYVITGQDRYCLTCHTTQLVQKMESRESTSTQVLLTGVHSKVRCVGCHESSQIAGVLVNSIDRTRHVAGFAVGRRIGVGGEVRADRCLSCHRASVSVEWSDADRGIRVSHREPLAAGATCSECHKDSGHETDVLSPGMSTCLRCHDDKQASSACATCHTKDTAYATTRERLFVPSALVSKGDCEGCHSLATCDACHGIRMPHDVVFLQYGHARVAAFDGKTRICWRCHTQAMCGKCHMVAAKDTGVYWGHGPGRTWKELHKQTKPGAVAGCGCHGRSPWVQRGEDYCLECHDRGIR